MCSATQHSLPAVLNVTPWGDPVVETHGFGPDHPYIDHVLLPVLGPSATVMWTHLARQLLDTPALDLDTAELLACLGLGQRLGRNDVGARTLARLVCHHLARHDHTNPAGLFVRTAAGPLPEHRARTLPLPARLHHQTATKGTGPKFRLGRLHVTAAALGAMVDAHADPAQLLTRHQHGDWGYITTFDTIANNEAVTTGRSIRSAYTLISAAGITTVVIVETNGARSSTTISVDTEE